MKQFIVLSLLLFTCNHSYDADAQRRKINPANQKITEGLKELEKSNDTLRLLQQKIRQLAVQKIVYRTKIIIQHDTAWRVDTCTTIYKPIDSATIAIMFRQPDVQKEIKVGKRIQIVILKKRKHESK